MEVASGRSTVRVLMLPWLAHGHISPFLELGKKLADRNFHIYFCSTPVNLDSLKPKLSNSKYSNSIELVELHLPSFPELPPHYHTTKGLPPHLTPILHKASDISGPKFSNIAATLSPDVIIYDFHAHWIHDIAASLNIPVIAFIPCGAAMVSCMHHNLTNKDGEFPFPEVASTHIMKKKLAQIRERSSASDSKRGSVYTGSFNIVLINSFREIEEKYMDYLSVSLGLKILPVGLLVPDPVYQDDNDEGLDIIKWLDKKEKSSTVYVSFGSEYYLSKEDMQEVSLGLELSEVNFIWVVRFPEGEKTKLEEALPKGFLERVKERGLVVENWAPQIKILNHSSIGGFVSHCGWGSVLESLKFGVPIIAMPMQIDQPWNARVLVSSGVGLEVEKEINNEKIERENMAKVIKQIVMEKIGKDIRRKAKEIGNNLKSRAEEDMDEVKKEIFKVCGIF
ncbi:hypothetical protein FNV43_RR10608 [Rhamnella rubrinervis]|uniref:Glycosyltransferase n=1 Tax=Rhamnella rubrinervis TaxID=2594499 RepID=A0A8K0MGZ5_9ROSA|nr:hypothetical protein FNV43_RR10608 [Rhamnella rubrinervis]